LEGRALPWVVAALLLLTLAAGLAVVALKRRELAEALLVDQLRALGLDASSVRVESLGPRSLELRELRLGATGDLRVDSLEATYSISSLRAGRFESIRITGLLLRIDVGPDGVSFGSLDALLAGEPAPGSEAKSARAAGPLLPARVVEFEDAHALVTSETDAVDVLLRGRVEEPDRARDGALRFAFSAGDPQQRLVIGVHGTHDPVTRSGSARLRLHGLDFDPKGLRPAQLVPQLKGVFVSVRGSLEAVANLRWRDGVPQGEMDLVVRDLDLSTEAGAVEQLNAAVHLEGPWPPSTPPGQLLSMARVDIGLELTEGLVAFRLRRDGSLDLESAEWKFAGGTVRAQGHLDLAAEQQTFRLAFDAVDLATLLRLVNLSGLSGEGSLDGELPLVRTGSRYEIRGGRLSGSPGGGTIRWQADPNLAAVAASTPGLDTVVEALPNFHYQKLELKLDGDPAGDVLVNLHLAGSNPDYLDGHPVELNLNVEATLGDLLRAERTAYAVPAVIEKRIDAAVGGLDAE
jgi:hypothetical protein